MSRLAPYQLGVWLAEYLNRHCQLCRTHHSQLNLINTANKSSLLLHDSGLLCAHCQQSILWLPPSFMVDIADATSLTIQAATYYDYPIRQAFRAFKHSEDMTKLPLLVHVLRQLPRPTGCNSSNSVIIAMPTTDNRLMKRGFDPVTILSIYLSKHWGIPLWQGVQRIDSTVSQQGLTRSERLANLNEAFRVTQPSTVKRLLLFDDIATTGASLQALARSLYNMDQATHTPPTTSNAATSTICAYKITAYALAHGSY